MNIAPSPSTTVTILIGASEWPKHSELNSSAAFRSAAAGVRSYFIDVFGIQNEHLLDLFDSNDTADEIDQRMGEFLAAMNPRTTSSAVRDVIVYFIGHGGFSGPGSDYYLALRRTRADNLSASAMSMQSLAHTLRERARHLRRLLILDCCFSGSAFRSFQSGPSQVAIQQTVDAFRVSTSRTGFPAKGTTLLCSSGQKVPSLIMPDESSTMFSSALLRALATGSTSAGRHLSVRELASLAADLLEELADAPRPLVHSPDQSEGDVADVGLFPNLAPDSSDLPSPRDLGWAIDEDAASRDAASRVSAWIQWADEQVRAVDSLRSDEKYWTAYVRNDSGRPADYVLVTCRSTAQDHERPDLVITWNAPAVPGERTWYILRDTESFPADGEAPEASIEFTMLNHRWRKEGAALIDLGRMSAVEAQRFDVALAEAVEACEEYLQPQSLRLSDAIAAGVRERLTDASSAWLVERMHAYLGSDRPAERTVGYILVGLNPQVADVLDLVRALRLERSTALVQFETRPMWQLFVAIERKLGSAIRSADRALIRVALQEMSEFLRSQPAIDEGGQCKYLLAELVKKSKTKAKALR